MFMPASILVASASPFRREHYAAGLRRSGYSVGLADGGVNCLTQARQHRPDVVILEMSLPWGGSDGLLALRDEEPALRHAAIIFVESCKSPADLYKLGRISTHDFFLFQRLPSISEVIRTIDFVLRQRQVLLPTADSSPLNGLEMPIPRPQQPATAVESARAATSVRAVAFESQAVVTVSRDA